MLLWIDGFDHYGGDVVRLRDGVYSEVNGAQLVTVGNAARSCVIGVHLQQRTLFHAG